MPLMKNGNPPPFLLPNVSKYSRGQELRRKDRAEGFPDRIFQNNCYFQKCIFFPLGRFYVVQPVYIGSVTKHNVSIVVLIKNMLVLGSITNTMNRWSVDLLRTGFQPCMIQTHPGIRKVAGIVSIKPACLIITIKRRL